MSNNALVTDGEKRIAICKECVKKSCYNSDGSLDVDKFKEVLMLMDKPYIPQVLNSAIAEIVKRKETGNYRSDVIGLYMKNVSGLMQYKDMSFIESLNMDKTTEIVKDIVGKTLGKEGKNKNDEIYVRGIEDFEVTDEILDRFGEGYSKSEYRKMQRKYDKLKQNYQLSTNLHEEALATYVRFKVKEEQSTAVGDVNGAEKWNRAAQDAADKAKLTPKQLTQADLQGGITAISEISKAVEESADIIEILPRFKFSPNDACDFLIWCYINFARKLRGLPEVEYKAVYEFYDRKKAEYIAQYGDVYGIFSDDATENNRETIERFIKLPKDYNTGGDG